MRRTYIALIALALVVFLAISAVLARVFSADGAERTAITGLIDAEARGDQQGMLDRMTGCRQSPTCSALVARDAAALVHPGSVSILQLTPSTGFSLTSTVGYARVAWNVGGSLPRVQCVRVRRAGDAVSGIHIQLLSITRRLASDGTCP